MKISFCTVCMNRLEYLKQTLPQNIKDNLSYPDVEFVVLNYNSTDGLDTWINNEMRGYLEDKTLIYAETRKPCYFRRSHAKNIAAKMATGDIICNVDADNYLGEGFAAYVNDHFSKKPNSFLSVNKNAFSKDCYGRICVPKKHFTTITGYDESMVGYGFEDFDLVNRLEILGLEASHIGSDTFLKVIRHDNESRLKNEEYLNEINAVYIRHINHFSSELLFLFRNGTCSFGTMTINRLKNSESVDNIFAENRKFDYAYELKEFSWRYGTWKAAQDYLITNMDNRKLKFIISDRDLVIAKGNEMIYNKCTKYRITEELIMFYSQIENRSKMITNKNTRKIVVNNAFGEI
ncbi:glycosyltransferase family 2 protein [Sinomicrobium sp. M5D2P9]